MIHIDIKKLGRFDKIGHRITGEGRKSGGAKTPGQLAIAAPQGLARPQFLMRTNPASLVFWVSHQMVMPSRFWSRSVDCVAMATSVIRSSA